MSVSVETVREVAKMFVDNWGDRARVHVAVGKMAATDGRILFSVMRQDIAPDPDRDLVPNEGILNFRPIGEETVLLGREELEPITSAVLEAWRDSYDDFLKRQRAFDADPKRLFNASEDGYLRKCPCCGEEFIDDGYGMYTPFEEWLDENRPDERTMKGVIWSLVPGHEEPVPASVYYMSKALSAAKLLGGAGSLSIFDSKNKKAPPQFVLRGPDWFIDLKSMRGQERDAKFDIDLDFRRNGAK